jgi:hypothetical protein
MERNIIHADREVDDTLCILYFATNVSVFFLTITQGLAIRAGDSRQSSLATLRGHAPPGDYRVVLAAALPLGSPSALVNPNEFGLEKDEAIIRRLASLNQM